jgi:hypothetical protein
MGSNGKYYTENYWLSNTNSTIKLRWTQMLLKGRQVLLHYKTEMNSDALEGFFWPLYCLSF